MTRLFLFLDMATMLTLVLKMVYLKYYEQRLHCLL